MVVPSDSDRGAWIGVGAMVLAVAAAFVFGAGTGGGAGSSCSGPQCVPVAAALEDVERGEDHIGADALARLLMAQQQRVALIDLRPEDEFAKFHLPGARRMTVPEAAGAAGQELCRAHDLVVLYSNGPAHPGQAWLELRRAGHGNARVLDGGLAEFQARVLTPPSLAGNVDEAAAKAAASTFALQRAWFVGSGAPNPAATWATDPAELKEPTVVSAAWLRARLGRVAVVDVRDARADHDAWHVPGAVHLPIGSLRRKHGDRDLWLLPPDQLAARIGALGIAPTTPVVLCADDKLQNATFAALAFLRLGHRAVAILEGGIQHWAVQRQPLTAAPSRVQAVDYPVRAVADADGIAIDALAQAVAAKQTAVLDVRPPEFFRGEKSTEARPGHIPGAVNRPFQQDLLRNDDGQFWQDRKTLEASYRGLFPDPAAPIAVHCRTGHTGSESYFVLRYLLGYQGARWFNGSWTEWAERKDLPAETVVKQ